MNTPEHDATDPRGEVSEIGTLADLRGLVGGAQAILTSVSLRGLTDTVLGEFVLLVEDLGRLVDAVRVAGAGEIAERSRPELGKAGLAPKQGCRDASMLVQRWTGISARSAATRLSLGRETYRRTSLSGHKSPARFAGVAAAVAAGRLGIDSAVVIVRGLSPVIGRCRDELWLGAEAELVAAAVECTADETRVQAEVWKAALDPDGVEPSEERSMRRRALRLSADAEGMVRVSGLLVPAAGAQLTKLLDAYLTPRTQPAFLSREERDGVDAGKDPRSRDQQRHDIFAGLVDCAARSAETASVGGAAPTVLVTISETEWKKTGAAALASASARAGAGSGSGAGAGSGAVEGVGVPVSLRTVRQFACTGGVQPVVLSGAGEVVALGSPQRCFTAQQRRAIAVRDGGCLIPGCMVPASWCEIHHVIEASAGGPTHTSNGVLLCWFHHRTIETSGWQVRMDGGVPYVKAPPWPHPDPPWRPVTKSLTRLLDATKQKTHDRFSG